MKNILSVFQSRQKQRNELIASLIRSKAITVSEGILLMDSNPKSIHLTLSGGGMSSGAKMVLGDDHELGEHAMNTTFGDK